MCFWQMKLCNIYLIGILEFYTHWSGVFSHILMGKRTFFLLEKESFFLSLS